jgi:hypothetical protein
LAELETDTSGALASPTLTLIADERSDKVREGLPRQSAKRELTPKEALARVAAFFGLLLLFVLGMHALITSGLRRIRTSEFGAWNQMMDGNVNAQVVITGSSRAAVQYDPRTIEHTTGKTAFNLGRNGSQTDIQLAVLKSYLRHNRKPDVVIHNLDAFTFVTSREIFDPAQYVPYLDDPELYQALKAIDKNQWKSRYIPLYGYVAEDMNFTWMRGVQGFFGRSPAEDYFLGFNPRFREWGPEFDRYKEANKAGVSFDIEPAGLKVLEELAQVCKDNGIELIFVYSPEYVEMQSLEKNRPEIFARFRDLADRYNIPVWDYSQSALSSDRNNFYNSQHLNAGGAAVFSQDVANRLQDYFVARAKTKGDLTAASGAASQSSVAR